METRYSIWNQSRYRHKAPIDVAKIAAFSSVGEPSFEIMQHRLAGNMSGARVRRAWVSGSRVSRARVRRALICGAIMRSIGLSLWSLCSYVTTIVFKARLSYPTS